MDKEALNEEDLKEVTGGGHFTESDALPTEEPYFEFLCTGCGGTIVLAASESVREHPCLCGKPGAYWSLQRTL